MLFLSYPSLEEYIQINRDNMKKIVVAGGTGFIGQHFIKMFKDEYQYTIITRSKKSLAKKMSQVKVVEWQDKVELRQAITEADVVLNFVGENIGAQRWSKQQKQLILRSRVQATQTISDLMLQYNPTARLLNASAIGIYGLQKSLSKQRQHVYSEDSPLPDVGQDFLSEVGLAWEQPLNVADNHGLKVVKLRFGVVLAKDGGMLKKLLLPFKLGLGGRVGSGEQPISWIGISDVISIINLLIQEKQFRGAINIVAPEVVSQKQFSATLAKVLHRPMLCPLPSAVVKWLFGQMGQELLLSGQSVISNVLPTLNYKFEFPNLESLLRHELCS